MASRKIPSSFIWSISFSGYALACIKGSPSRTVILDDAGIPAGRLIGAEGTDFKTALATLNHEADTAMKLEAACQLTYHAAALLKEAMAAEKAPSLTFVFSACKTMNVGHGDVRHHRRGAVAGLRIPARLPGRADDARRQDHPDALPN
jgi:alkylation response protein AidB-like acyl-CoA dehydrogenase